MKDFIFSVLIVLIKALVSFTEDDASSVIFCNTELLNWQEAVGNCTNKGGYMLPFETGLGQNIEKLHLQSEIDVWTADYIIKLETGNDEYCGFNYLNSTFYVIREPLYGDCNANRNYFCKSETGMLEVYNSTRENVHCNYNVQINDLHSMRFRIKPGYYWNSGTLHGKASKVNTKMDYCNVSGKLCGAYKSSIGMYYANCKKKRYSLCSSNGKRPINNICFEAQTTLISEHTKTLMKTTISPTTVSQETTTDKSAISTKQLITASTSVEHKTNVEKIHTQEQTQSSDIWLHVFVPLGGVLSLTFGITFIFYIYRKRLLNRERMDQPTNISNLTPVSGQSDYESLEHQQRDEHMYSSARQVESDRVAMNTYVNDAVYRTDK